MKTRTRLGKKLQGWLSILATTPQHSGNYSCVPSYTKPDWVVVHIIPGNITLLTLHQTGWWCMSYQVILPFLHVWWCMLYQIILAFLHYTRLGGGAYYTI